MTSQVRRRSATRQLSPIVLAALFATSLLVTAPSSARAGTGVTPEPTPLGSRVSLPSGAGSVAPTAANPAIALGTRSFPFGRLDAALLVLGSAVLTGLAIGALRVLWSRPLPLLLEPAATRARPWESPATPWSDEARKE